LRQGDLFLEPDPLGPVDSPNLYQAFGFDGLNVRDPFGECWLTGDDVPCSVYAREIGRTFFSPSPKASIARAKATGRFLKHEAIGAGKFVTNVAKLGRQVVRHPIRSAQAAGHAAVNVSEGFRALVDSVAMDPVEALKEAGASAQELAANADPDAVAEGVGGTLAGVVAFEAGGRAVSALRGTLAERLAAPGRGALGPAAAQSSIQSATADTPYYRYVREREAEAIRRTGRIPNVDATGKPKDVYITNRYYKTAGRAKTHLQLPRKPFYRVRIEPENVPNRTPFSRVRPEDHPEWGIGGGTEAITRDEVVVDPTALERLKGAGR